MGPNSDNPRIMRKLVENGMDVARFNFSHGDHAEQKSRMDLLKKVRAELKKPIAMLLDTKGPEIRTGLLEGGKKLALQEGQEFTLTSRQMVGNDNMCYQTYENLPRDLKPGDRVLIDDGLIELTVKSTTDTDVVCQVDNGGELGERKGIKLPFVEVKLPGITEKDRQDIIFGIEQDIDFIAASFIRDADASASAWAWPGSSVPLVVSVTSSMPGTAYSIRASCGRSRRQSGSPPVSLTWRTPSLASAATAAVISSKRRMRACGTKGTPAAGMQYWQRRLQRSVTDTRT